MFSAEEILKLSEKAKNEQSKLKCKTEEATKHALVQPFITALGYDIHNIDEVEPEYTADVAGANDRKVDYAIMREGHPIIIVECKQCGAKLDEDNKKQLHRYFVFAKSKIAILTDGIKYLFFSNAEDDSSMDPEPFMRLNLLNITESDIQELAVFHKANFDHSAVIKSATDKKWNKIIKEEIGKSFNEPPDELCDLFIKRIGYNKKAGKNQNVGKSMKEKFSIYLCDAFKEFIDDKVSPSRNERNEPRINIAQTPISSSATLADEAKEAEIEDKELLQEQIKFLMMGIVNRKDVTIKEKKNYWNILLASSQQKRLMRLFYNDFENMQIELIGAGKEPIFHDISTIEDILPYTETIRATAQMYEAGKA